MRDHRRMRTAPLVLCLGLAACGSRDFTITSGLYVVTAAAGHMPADDAAVRGTQLTINHTARTASFSVEGQGILMGLTPAPEDQWAEGCPTNVSVARMEVAKLETTELALKSLRIASPMMFSGCGSEPPSNTVFIVPAPVGKNPSACADGSATPCLALSLATR